MRVWKGIGKFLSSHMAFVSPACVLLSVIFPEVFGQLKPFVPVFFAFMTFRGALDNDFHNLVEAIRHPLPMLVTLGLSIVVIPFCGYLLGTAFFGFDASLVCGIVIEYSVPVAVVSIMWVSLRDGSTSYALATLLISTVLAPVTIPATLQVLLGQTVRIDVAWMMAEMLFTIALPALAGTTFNHASHGWGKSTLSPVLAPAATIALVLIILGNSTRVAPYLRNLTPTLVAVMVFICVFAAFGYLLGMIVARAMRQDDATVVAMTYQVGMRNIAAGAVIAADHFPSEVMFPVVIGTLFQQVLAALFGNLLDRVLGARGEDAGDGAECGTNGSAKDGAKAAAGGAAGKAAAASRS